MTRAVRLGMFVFSTLLILSTGVFLIGRRQSLFRATYLVKASFHNVAGLTGGADVRVGGIHQGTVHHIELPRRPGEEVTVVMSLYKGTQGLVRKDSRATILSEGLLGDKYVQVSFGSDGGEIVKNGDWIQSEPPFDMSDLIRKANEILDSTKTVAQNAEGVTSNLKSVTSKIDEGKGTVGALIHDKTIYNQATAGVTSFREDMDALKHSFFLRGFFNRRGYMDSEELTKHQIGRRPGKPYSRAFVYETKRLFEKSDSAKLKNKSLLNDAGKFLEETKFDLAVVEATAGPLGDSEKTRVLTEAQTVAVRKYLAENFKLDDTRIKTLGRGKAQEIASPANAVQILVYAGVKQENSAQSPVGSR